MSQEPSNELQTLIQDPELIEKLVESTAPHLIDCRKLKLATLYYLVGASRNQRINVLIVGDPGTGKSHLLNWVAKLLDTRVMDYLSPDMRPDNILLENINRLNTMEQRLLESIMKSQPPGSVYASSRPLLGRYNRYKTVTQNIHLPVGLLGLFDLVFVQRDIPDKDKDHRIAMKLLGQDNTVHPPVETGLLRRYLTSTRTLNPVLSGEARSILIDFYTGLRAQSTEDDCIMVSPWQLVTLRKLSEARAKLHHREVASAEDAEAAVSILSHCLEQVGVDPVRRRYDVDVLYTGRPAVLNSRLLHVAEAFMELEKTSTPVKRIDLESLLWERYGMTKRTVSLLLQTLIEDGFITEQRPGQYKRKEWGMDGF